MAETTETAYLAGGCTWTMQPLLDRPEGVVTTRTGFMGGVEPDPDDEDCGGHAEVTEVVFDPERLSFRDLLELFFQVHRPDLPATVVGSQYRSEIFCVSEQQRAVARETIRDVDASGHWPGPTLTDVSDAAAFWPDPDDDQHHLAGFPRSHPTSFPSVGAEHTSLAT